ncbi:MAG: hypothetical protein R3B74_01535 [Nitrospirales bacterium]|nr:hypothetical protein [Nitrospirales bacterium]
MDTKAGVEVGEGSSRRPCAKPAQFGNREERLHYDRWRGQSGNPGLCPFGYATDVPSGDRLWSRTRIRIHGF